ncbi:MAG: hypothetical protein PF448_03595 [Bacteroidales bacterium]|jgi:predicted negative regulator of RcsB-dependent stress response|nr:hypothetical protein [Bacteroidales bacterium]
MANIRDLKKDLKWLTYEVLTDCMIAKLMNEDKSESVDDLMHETMNNHTDMITRINEARKIQDNKEKKTAFKSIEKDMYETADGSFKKLSEIVK